MEASFAPLSRLAAAWLVLAVVWPCPVSPQEPSEPPRQEDGGEAGTARRKKLHLGLNLVPEGSPPRDFTLFKDDALGAFGLGMDRTLLSWHDHGFMGPPTLAGVRAISLGLTFRNEPDAQGKRRLTIGPLSKSWDDLTAYEKFGVVLQYAAGLAGAAYMIDRVLD